MAFFQLALKARRLKKANQIYQDEKLKSIEVSRGAKIHYTFFQKIRHKKLLLKMRMKKCWKLATSCPEDSWFHEKAVLLRTDGTFENYILKSILGFIGGIFLTYLFFMFFVFQLNFTLSSATLLCSIFGIILTIGLAFSPRVRCLVFLLMPQFFSKRGRQALMAYAFILALTGPAKNMLHNTGVLSESLACGQEQLKEAVRAIVDLVKQPFYALRDGIAEIVKTVKIIVKKIKEALLAIKRIVLSILKVFKTVFQWLGSIINICNKKLGTPFERCKKVFSGAVADCKATLGPLFGGICNLVYIVDLLCWTVKPFDFICMLVSFVTDTIIGAVRKKIRKFVKHMKAIFYVKVKFSHSFHFETNQSKSLSEVTTGIVTEIRSKTDKFLTVFDWMSFATSFFFMFMLLRVIHYRHKWLTNDRFDNRYLTDDLREIDLRRARNDKETVLPLNPRERNKYIPLTSIILIKAEKIKLTRSAVFLTLTTFKLCIHMVADYSLYWVLSTIRYHGRFETKVQAPNSVGVYVSGSGFLAELYRSIVRAFSPLGSEMVLDSMPCLPDPIPPDMDRYTQIIFLIVFCWIMAIFEPYGLRLRQVVMGYYHPERAKQRAVWLYNHIIRSRGSFLKFARRQLRRKFTKSDKKENIEKVTVTERIGAICPLFNKLCGEKQRICLVCAAVERDNQPPHIKCPKPGCIGLFCLQCFADLQNLCTICLEPIDYGDLSDMSEEKDSSDDQVALDRGRKLRSEMVEKERIEGEIGVEEKVVGIGKDQEEEEEETEKEREEKSRRSDYDDKDDDKGNGNVGTMKENQNFDDSDLSTSPSTNYSYTYQEESNEEPDLTQQRTAYKDVEAQKVKDDVTIQVFNEPLTVEESSSSDDDTTSCFAIRGRRKIKMKPTPKPPSSHLDNQSSSTTSIANTESFPEEEIEEEEVEGDAEEEEEVEDAEEEEVEEDAGEEEVEEDAEEEVIDVGMKDGSDQRLLKGYKNRQRKKRKGSRVKKIIGMMSRVSWLVRGNSDQRIMQRKKPTLLNKIVNMLHTKNSQVPREIHDRMRELKSRGRESISMVNSSSSCESLTDNVMGIPPTAEENGKRISEILSPRISSSKSETWLARRTMRKVRHMEYSCSSDDNFHMKSQDSQLKRRKRRGRRVLRECRGGQQNEKNMKHPHEKMFETKELPRNMEPVMKSMKYSEINEKKNHHEGLMNKLSDTKLSSGSTGSKDKWNITSSDESYNSRTGSGSSFDGSHGVVQCNKNRYELDMSTIEEDSDESTPKIGRNDLESLTCSVTEEYIDVTGISSTTTEFKPDEETKGETGRFNPGEQRRKRHQKRSIASEIESLNFEELSPAEEKQGGHEAPKKRKVLLEQEKMALKSKPSHEPAEISPQPASRFLHKLRRKADNDLQKLRKRKIDRIFEDDSQEIKNNLNVQDREQSVGKKRRIRVLGDSDKLEKSVKRMPSYEETSSEEGTDIHARKRIEDINKTKLINQEEVYSSGRSETRSDSFTTDETTDSTETHQLMISQSSKFEKARTKKLSTTKTLYKQSLPKYGKITEEPSEQTSDDSYYTDPEVSPRATERETGRSSFTDDGSSPRKSHAGRHKTKTFKNYDYHSERQQDKERRIISRSSKRGYRNPQRHEEVICRKRKEEGREPRRRFRVGRPEGESRRIRHDSSHGEQPGQRVSGFRPIMYRGSGDSSSWNYDAHSDVDYNLRSRSRSHQGSRYLFEERGYEDDNLRYGPYNRGYSREEANRQRVRNMFKQEYPEDNLLQERLLRDHYNVGRYRRDYHSDEFYNVPMYNPSIPRPERTRHFIPDTTSPRHPQRYPSPRNYPEGVDPYYGISSSSPECQKLQSQEPSRFSLKNVNVHLKPDQKKRQEIPAKLPVLARFLPMSHKPELITELKEHDRMRLIQERETQKKKFDSSKKLQMAGPSAATRESEDISLPCQETERRRLPYQETQAFKNVVDEFEQTHSLKQKNKKTRVSENLASASRTADHSRNVTQLYPPVGGRSSNAVSRITSRIISVFKANKSKQKKASFGEAGEFLLEQSAKELKDNEIWSEMSSSSLNYCERGNRPDDLSSDTTEDTTDNNETTF